MGRGDNLTILYPPGCKEVTEDLSPDELIRRLKTLAHTLQSMGQDDGAYQVIYIYAIEMDIWKFTMLFPKFYPFIFST